VLAKVPASAAVLARVVDDIWPLNEGHWALGSLMGDVHDRCVETRVLMIRGDIVETFTIGLGRDWWVRLLACNPLVRSSDRIEVMVLSLAVLLTVVAVPIAGAVGTSVYDAHTRVYAHEAQTRHQVTATAIEDGNVLTLPESLSFTAWATWSAAGRNHSEIVMWSDLVKAVDQQSIWVNADGAKVGPPSSSSNAAADAVGIGINVWLGVAAASAGLVYLVRRGLDHRRYAEWDCELNASRENHGLTNHQ
jgi:hypothetical protein